MNRRNMFWLLVVLGALAGLGVLGAPSRAATPARPGLLPVAGWPGAPPHVPMQGTATPTATVCAGGGTPAPWVVVSPVAVAVFGVSMDGDGTNAYAVGGYNFQTSSETTQFARYNPGSNAWTSLSPVPDLDNGEAATVYDPLGNKLYVFGGENFATTEVTSTTRIYDLAGGTWSPGPPLPGIRAGMASGYYNGKIYLVGGYSTGNINPAFTQTWEFSIAGGTWLTKTAVPAPAGFGDAGFGVVNGHLYLAGGRDANNALLNTVYDYNIAADTWTARAPLPTVDTAPGSAVINGTLWVFGGGNPFGAALETIRPGAPATTNATMIYDPGSNTWTSGPPLNQARSFLGGTHVGSVAIAVGGYTGSTTTNSVETSTNPVVSCGTATATSTSTGTSTTTPLPTSTAGFTADPTPLLPTSTATTAPTQTASPTARPSATPCALSFTDVHATDYFYTPVLYLACHGVISGYSNGDGTFSFRPYNNTTRSQMVKIVVLGFGLTTATPPAGGYTFADVPPANPFFGVVETAAAHAVVSGYTCGGPNEPCDSANRPYFRPYTNVTRGQLSKIDVVAAGWAVLNPPGPGTFADVLPGTAFYTFVETAFCHGIISGYSCGGAGEPCDNQNRPYFRQYTPATRGQIAKIVYLSLTGNGACSPIVRPGW
ncbi:MAG TPA: kelch repeat-containing protein [Chloroflexia bacterium]|nr:kelch repeat-containing protein [Chloroflexia bacterium]